MPAHLARHALFLATAPLALADARPTHPLPPPGPDNPQGGPVIADGLRLPGALHGAAEVVATARRRLPVDGLTIRATAGVATLPVQS
jgi:hypothetical protein